MCVPRTPRHWHCASAPFQSRVFCFLPVPIRTPGRSFPNLLATKHPTFIAMADDSNQEAHDKAASGQEHAEQAAQDFKSAATAKVNDLKDAATSKVNDLKGAATAKAGEYRDQASAKIEDLRGQATAKAEELRGQAEAAWGDAKVKARTYQDDGEAYVRENPTKARSHRRGCWLYPGCAAQKVVAPFPGELMAQYQTPIRAGNRGARPAGKYPAVVSVSGERICTPGWSFSAWRRKMRAATTSRS